MKSAIGFYDYTASRLPFTIERVQTDNGSEFQSAFNLHLLDQIDDTNLFNDNDQEWEDYYNYYRSHGGLAGQTPYERLKEKTNSTNQDTIVKEVRQLHTLI